MNDQKTKFLFLCGISTLLWNCVPSWQRTLVSQYQLKPSEYQFFNTPEKKDFLGFLLVKDWDDLSSENLQLCFPSESPKKIDSLSSFQNKHLSVQDVRLEKAIPGPTVSSCYLRNGDVYQVVTEQFIAKQFSKRESMISKQLVNQGEDLTLGVRLQKVKVFFEQAQCEAKEGQVCDYVYPGGKIQISKVNENSSEAWFELSSQGKEPTSLISDPKSLPTLCHSGKNHLKLEEGCRFYPNESSTLDMRLVRENNQLVLLVSAQAVRFIN